MTKVAAPSLSAPPLSPDELQQVAKRIARNARIRRPDGVEPEDTMQDAAVAILRVQSDWPKAAPNVPFENWLFRRVIGILQDQYGTQHARAKRKPPAHAAPAMSPGFNDGTYTAEAPAENHDLRMDLDAAIAKLPRRQRFIVSAIMLEGRTQEETARALGVSQTRVSQQFTMAKETLKQLLGADYAD